MTMVITKRFLLCYYSVTVADSWPLPVRLSKTASGSEMKTITPACTHLTLVWRCTYRLWKLLVLSVRPKLGPCSLWMISAFITRAMCAGSSESSKRSCEAEEAEASKIEMERKKSNKRKKAAIADDALWWSECK